MRFAPIFGPIIAHHEVANYQGRAWRLTHEGQDYVLVLSTDGEPIDQDFAFASRRDAQIAADSLNQALDKGIDVEALDNDAFKKIACEFLPW